MSINAQMNTTLNYVLTASADTTIQSVFDDIVAVNCAHTWNSLVIDLTRVRTPFIAIGEVYNAFQQFEHAFGEDIDRCKPIAFVEPLDPETASAFDFFYNMASNFFEWSVRTGNKRIRRFSSLDEAERWALNASTRSC